MTTANLNASTPAPSVPLFGSLARSVKMDGSVAILLTLIVALVLWGAAFALFGIPGLYLPAVAASPLVLGTLVWLTFG